MSSRLRPTAPAGSSRNDTPELVVDPIACVGHGLCAELFPEGIVLDDWGYPILLDEARDPALGEHARRAVAACPALALRLRARAGTGRRPSAPRGPAWKRGDGAGPREG